MLVGQRPSTGGRDPCRLLWWSVPAGALYGVASATQNWLPGWENGWVESTSTAIYSSRLYLVIYASSHFSLSSEQSQFFCKPLSRSSIANLVNHYLQTPLGLPRWMAHGLGSIPPEASICWTNQATCQLEARALYFTSMVEQDAEVAIRVTSINLQDYSTAKVISTCAISAIFDKCKLASCRCAHY